MNVVCERYNELLDEVRVQLGVVVQVELSKSTVVPLCVCEGVRIWVCVCVRM